MKANVLTIVVNSVSAIWTIQISKNIAHINTRFPSHQCDDNTSCLEKIRQIVKDGKTLSFYSKEQQDDLLYDIKKTSDANPWIRSVQSKISLPQILGVRRQKHRLSSRSQSPCFYVRGLREKLGDTQNSLPRI